MGLRKNNAELNSEIISLRKSLYQANPDAIDITTFFKESLYQERKQTRCFQHRLKTSFSNSQLLKRRVEDNNSFNSMHYSEVRGGSRLRRGTSIGVERRELTMGEKMMGRPCRENILGPVFMGETPQYGSYAAGWETGSRLQRFH